ncbi:MAG: SH3 domain-containing protein [Pseudomonadota bacterium]
MKRFLLTVTIAAGVLSAWMTTASACACCESWKVTNVEPWDVLNIRSGPSHKFSIVGTIPPESACVIRHDECRRNWCRISYAEYTGWVNVRYLEWKP